MGLFRTPLHGGRGWKVVALPLLAVTLPLAPLHAQELTLTLKRDASASALAPCESVALPEPGLVTESDREEAARLASSATQASIVGDHGGARDLLLRAVRLDPESGDVAYLLGRSYEELANTGAAMREYCRYLALDPEAPDAADVGARLARLVTPEATQLTPEAERAFRNGLAQYDLGRLAQAAQAFTAVLQVAPDYAPAYFNRGALYTQLDRADVAAENLSRYLELAPDAPDRDQVTAALAVLRNPARSTSRRTALVSSLVLPGTGQLYSGRRWRGLAFLSAAATSILVGELSDKVNIECRVPPTNGTCAADDIVSETSEKPYRTAGYLTAAAVAIYSAVDAYRGTSPSGGGSGAGITLSAGAEHPSIGLPQVGLRFDGAVSVTLLGLRF